jgi:hypothetical protein
VVAGKAIAAGDLRALTIPQFDRAKQMMTAIVAESLPRTSAKIRSPMANRRWRRLRETSACW